MKEPSPSFCLLPWLSMAIRNNGDYRVCCHANTSNFGGLLTAGTESAVLNAAKTGLEEARNSDTLKKIRREMLDGIWPESCSRCRREEGSKIRSKRLYSKDLFPSKYSQDWAASVTGDDGSILLEKAPLLDLDVRFGNKCNLACRMCGPSDSSAWAADHKKLGGHFSQTGFDWYEEESFWKSMETHAPEVEHLYIVGGEPLLIDRHYEFLEDLVKNGKSSKVTLEYNTNLTVLPQKILDLWRPFRKVRLGVSFDGAYPVNDYIRHPSRFHIIERNLERIDRAEGNFQVWLACTVSIYNLHHLVDLMKWVRSKKFLRIGKTPRKEFFVPHPVHKPEYLNIQALPSRLKVAYEEKLQSDLDSFLGDETLNEGERKRAREVVHTYVNFMNARDLSRFWPKFESYTHGLDRIRKQDYRVLKAPFVLEKEALSK